MKPRPTKAAAAHALTEDLPLRDGMADSPPESQKTSKASQTKLARPAIRRRPSFGDLPTVEVVNMGLRPIPHPDGMHASRGSSSTGPRYATMQMHARADGGATPPAFEPQHFTLESSRSAQLVEPFVAIARAVRFAPKGTVGRLESSSFSASPRGF